MSIEEQQAPADPPQQPAPIKYYEVNSNDIHHVTLTCHPCRATFDMRVSKARVVQFCPCCGKLGQVESGI